MVWVKFMVYSKVGIPIYNSRLATAKSFLGFKTHFVSEQTIGRFIQAGA